MTESRHFDGRSAHRFREKGQGELFIVNHPQHPTPKRIDLVGASGVGKSTLLSQVKSQRGKIAHAWVEQEEAKRAARRNALRAADWPARVKAWLRLARHGFAGPSGQELHALRAENAVASLIKQDPAFLRFYGMCLVELAGSDAFSPWYLVDYLLWKIPAKLESWAFLRKWADPSKVIVMDESLTFHLLYWTKTLDCRTDLLQAYCQSESAPRGVIFVKDAPDSIVRKRLERSAKRASKYHKPVNDNQEKLKRSLTQAAEVQAYLEECLDASGLPVVKVNLYEEKAEDAVALVTRFIGSIASDSAPHVQTSESRQPASAAHPTP